MQRCIVDNLYLFLQLFLDLLSFSGAIFSALARYPVCFDKFAVDMVETFFDEELSLIKDSLSEIKVLIYLIVLLVRFIMDILI